jgi:hypothetical protein
MSSAERAADASDLVLEIIGEDTVQSQFMGLIVGCLPERVLFRAHRTDFISCRLDFQSYGNGAWTTHTRKKASTHEEEIFWSQYTSASSYVIYERGPHGSSHTHVTRRRRPRWRLSAAMHFDFVGRLSSHLTRLLYGAPFYPELTDSLSLSHELFTAQTLEFSSISPN